MKNLLRTSIGMVLGACAVAGCSNDDWRPHYVERVPVAAPDAAASKFEYERPKPMPEPPPPAPAPR